MEPSEESKQETQERSQCLLKHRNNYFQIILFGSLFVKTGRKTFLKVAPFPTFHTKKIGII